MKPFILICGIFLFLGCQDNSEEVQALQNKITQMEEKVDIAYKPGFGDFMGTIQAHHSKLWFAGINENWELADFEIHEIEETFEDIETYHAGRMETQLVSTINPALDSVSRAIDHKDLDGFKSSYGLLTNNCTDCHIKTNHPYIKITIPTFPEFSNQLFEREK